MVELALPGHRRKVVDGERGGRPGPGIRLTSSLPTREPSERMHYLTWLMIAITPGRMSPLSGISPAANTLKTLSHCRTNICSPFPGNRLLFCPIIGEFCFLMRQ